MNRQIQDDALYNDSDDTREEQKLNTVGFWIGFFMGGFVFSLFVVIFCCLILQEAVSYPEPTIESCIKLINSTWK